MPCDVHGCANETYMGWRPLTERLGKQICEYHWNLHKVGNFDLFDAFGFRRPAGIRKPAPKKDVPRCDCGREARPGRVVCMEPAAKQKTDSHEPEKPGPQTVPATEKPSGCKACGAQREPGHTFCPKCSRERKANSNRNRQKRHYLKAAKT